MHFFIFELNDFSVWFSTFRVPRPIILGHIKSDIKKMVKSGINKADFEWYQITIYIKNNLIFTTLRYFRFMHTSIKKISFDILDSFAKKFSTLLNDNEIELLINRKLNEYSNTPSLEKRVQKLFPYDIEIRIAGQLLAGMSTIMYLWPGLTLMTHNEDKHIPYNKTFNRIHILFKKFYAPEWQGDYRGNLRFISKEPYILYIVDSSKEYHYGFRPSIKDIFEKEKANPNILIIANKQDLPDAMSPEEIEKIMGYSTVGFSAVAPGAPERLEEIITDFLKE